MSRPKLSKLLQSRKTMVGTIRTLWVSLDSHLDWCVEKNPKERDPRTFHVDTSIEYCEEVLKLLRALR